MPRNPRRQCSTAPARDPGTGSDQAGSSENSMAASASNVVFRAGERNQLN